MVHSLYARKEGVFVIDSFYDKDDCWNVRIKLNGDFNEWKKIPRTPTFVEDDVIKNLIEDFLKNNN